MSLRNQSGFSLIELVVVMAIVGILMMVGVPQVQNYIAKAKRTEMRTNLAQLYAAEKSFYAEYSTYHDALFHVGYRPEGTMNYIYGFSSAAGLSVDLNITNAAVNTSIAQGLCDDQANASSSALNCFLNDSATVISVPSGYACARSTFLAFAAGAIHDDALVDEWSIDHRKIYTKVSDGIDPDVSNTN